jgi:hypothetical protein
MPRSLILITGEGVRVVTEAGKKGQSGTEWAIAFASANDLASALRRAEAAHGEHEKRTGQSDPNWPDWYAEYMVAEQAGKVLPQ